MRDWLIRNKRVVMLKIAVAVALAVTHYYPESRMGLLVNLLWLFLF